MRLNRGGWWFLAITLSVTIHGLLFLNLSKRKLLASPIESEPRV